MRALAIALGMSALLLLPASAAAQSCPMGQLYCSGGWCCPTTPDGGTNVCCNGNPQSAGCTTTGFCGTASDAGPAPTDGGGVVCPTGDLYCTSGWCCPPGEGGRMDVCCNQNSMANGCTSNGNCSTSAGGSSGGGSSSGGVMPPAGCGTSATFNSISCQGGTFCPANSTCAGTGCQCAQGYVAVDCSGNVCNGMCSPPSYFCAPASAVGASGSGSGSGGGNGSSGGSGSGGSSGCNAAAVDAGGVAPLLGLVVGAAALAFSRRRRSR